MNRGIVTIVLLVILAALAAIFIEVATLVAVKLAVAMETLSLTASIVIATTFAPVIARFAKLCGAAFFAGGVFPAALVAGFLRHDSNHALLALLLFALAVFFVFFAFLAREEFLAFGLRAAA